MFKAIDERHPTEVIVYIHGGLNNIDSAIAKSAMLADRLDVDDKFFIGICWNSNLMPTYDQHLLAVREGSPPKRESNRDRAGDAFGRCQQDIVVRLPLNLIDFLYQDAYVLRADCIHPNEARPGALRSDTNKVLQRPHQNKPATVWTFRKRMTNELSSKSGFEISVAG